MADQAGFARLWHELYDRLDTGRPEDAQKMAAAWLLVKTRDFKTGEFTLGPRYLEKRFNLSHGAAGRLILMVAETEKRLGQNRANGEPIPGHDSLEAGESQAVSGPAPGHDRANGGPIYRRVDVDGRKELSPSESVAASGDGTLSRNGDAFNPEEAFEAFWKACIKRGPKKDARKAWLAIRKRIPKKDLQPEHGCESHLDLYGLIYQRMTVWRDSEWRYRDADKVPHVASWLNRDGWQEQTAQELRDQGVTGNQPTSDNDDLPWADQ